MHKRDWKEIAYGRWCVVFGEDDEERFYNEKDAKEYQKRLEADGILSVLREDTKNED